VILPIGHADSAVRRQPWVTYALMAICVVTLLATHGGVAECEARLASAQERLVAALDAWAERPYLVVQPRALEALPPELAAGYRALAASAETAPASLAPFELAAEQSELDAQVLGALGDLQAAERAHPYRAHGLVPNAPTAWGLFAHMFMHAGWLHLLGNLFLLFIAGPALEDRWGRALFAGVYTLSGLGGALLFAALTQDPGIPLVGASGAISGVLGAFLVRFWSTQIRFWYFFWFGFRIWTGTFEKPAYLMLPLWLANEVLQAWLARALGVTSGVANTAHIGGFLVGAAAALAVRSSKLDARIDREIDALTSTQGNVAVTDALALREQGDLPGAIRALAAVVMRAPRDAEAVDAYWDACVAAGCAGDAAHAVLALAQRELAANDGARAAQRYVELRAALPQYGFDAAFVARLVPHFRAMDAELAKQALRWLAQPRVPALAPTLAKRALDQARELEPGVALELARKLAASDAPPEARERFAALANALAAELPNEANESRIGLALASETDAAHEGAASRAFDAARGAELATPDWDHTARPFEGDDVEPAHGAPESREPDAVAVSEGSALEARARLAQPEGEWDALALLEVDDPPTPLPQGPRFVALKTTEVTPLALEGGALRVALEGGRKAQLGLARVEAISLAAVRGLGAKPVLLVDLLLGWRALEGGELRCVRLRSDRFDPRKLASATDALAALRAFVAQLVAATQATPLHAADPARAGALTPFADLASYEREVLEVAG
jgi:membrane associated rhomboid family serine protease